jgi:hypothetical protein
MKFTFAVPLLLGSAITAQIPGAFSAAGNVVVLRYHHTATLLPNGKVAGLITTIAGNGTTGFSGDGGLATNAQLNLPSGVAVDSGGNVYVSDTYNFRVRKIDSSGIISTIAGTGLAAYSCDGVPSRSAALVYPTGLKVDTAGNLFVGDWVEKSLPAVSSRRSPARVSSASPAMADPPPAHKPGPGESLSILPG